MDKDAFDHERRDDDPPAAGDRAQSPTEEDELEGGEIDFAQPEARPRERTAAEPALRSDVRITKVETAERQRDAAATAKLAPPRDRIVVLGRRAAGKTIYLARLYDLLWQGRDGLSVRALDGKGHRACMEVVSELKEGRWPPGTLASTYLRLEISFGGARQRLVALDYPGEVFRRAFVDGVDAPDTRELIEHVDRASAVMLLIDPGVALREEFDEFIDDDFGMAQAIHRIRAAPGGARVPVAVLLTKCDQHRAALREAGGLRAFCVRRYRGLLRGVQLFRLYGTVAVHAERVPSGRTVPQYHRDPIGVVEPLRFCLAISAENRAREEAQLRVVESARAAVAAQGAALESQRRSVLTWSIAAAATLFVFGLVALVTLLMSGLL
ncbi:MAG TPA: hypothetical protein PKC43_11240 [Phycisphaerales bacterium]|nr:hypothetical protein [Phycisphaerales bacterium]HMP38007.1 hypothetical protein [Phycisphaerales bacterium]